MRPVRFGMIVIVSVALACSPHPLAPNGFLTGTWDGAEVPSGSHIQLVLTSAAGTVSGTAREFLGPQGSVESAGTVTGQYLGSAVSLKIIDPSGSSGFYVAQLTSTGQLKGTWTSSAGDTTIVWWFTQQAEAL